MPSVNTGYTEKRGGYTEKHMSTGDTVAIVGGGPGGLTLARLLQRAGVRVTVYERDESRAARQQGATLDLHAESGLKALRRAGLLAEFQARYRPGADQVVLADRDGRKCFADAAGGDPGRPEIDRGPLRDLLLDSLAPGTVVWGSRCVSLTPRSDGGAVRLDFADGREAAAALVVGADGASSKVRACLTPAEPVYTGITVVEGSVPNSGSAASEVRDLCGIGKVWALADSKTIFVNAKGDGRLSFYTGHRAPENWAAASGINFQKNAEVLCWFQGEFAGWSGIWSRLFRDSDTAFVPRPQYFLPQTPARPPHPAMTLIGDAAHLMPPYTGEGVNLAMQDALELAESLGRSENTAAAIAAYETRMRARAGREIRAALRQTEAFHSPNALAETAALLSSHHTETNADGD